jgi:hypothetical protein
MVAPTAGDVKATADAQVIPGAWLNEAETKEKALKAPIKI